MTTAAKDQTPAPAPRSFFLGKPVKHARGDDVLEVLQEEVLDDVTPDMEITPIGKFREEKLRHWASLGLLFGLAVKTTEPDAVWMRWPAEDLDEAIVKEEWVNRANFGGLLPLQGDKLRKLNCPLHYQDGSCVAGQQALEDWGLLTRKMSDDDVFLTRAALYLHKERKTSEGPSAEVFEALKIRRMNPNVSRHEADRLLSGKPTEAQLKALDFFGWQDFSILSKSEAVLLLNYYRKLVPSRSTQLDEVLGLNKAGPYFVESERTSMLDLDWFKPVLTATQKGEANVPVKETKPVVKAIDIMDEPTTTTASTSERIFMLAINQVFPGLGNKLKSDTEDSFGHTVRYWVLLIICICLWSTSAMMFPKGLGYASIGVIFVLISLVLTFLGYLSYLHLQLDLVWNYNAPLHSEVVPKGKSYVKFFVILLANSFLPGVYTFITGDKQLGLKQAAWAVGSWMGVGLGMILLAMKFGFFGFIVMSSSLLTYGFVSVWANYTGALKIKPPFVPLPPPDAPKLADLKAEGE